MSGFFITFEGSEGCGKSTQIDRLTTFLKSTYPAQEILCLREPGGTWIGEQIRHLLQYSEEAFTMHAETELLLFAASRAQLVREVIVPALARGAVVLCDRFFDSTTAYQGAARALDLDCVKNINHFATGGLVPNLTILLDLDVQLGRTRMAERNKKSTTLDRMEQESETFYEAVRHGYLALAASEPARWVVLDAAHDIETIAQQISRESCCRLDKVLL